MSPPIEARHQGPNRYQSSRWLWILFFVSALTTVVMFFVPAFIIRPFRHQAPRVLMLAMSLRQRAPLFTLVLALACFIMTYALWRISSRWGKAVLTLAMLVVTFSAVMARLNYFEWIFHPIVGPQFLAQSESKLESKEMIMAVRVAGDARAYPISQMAYHHVLNDVAGGVPIAVTY
jgi:heme/copper-type cytochrome/quinol oxidase subunit 3